MPFQHLCATLCISFTLHYFDDLNRIYFDDTFTNKSAFTLILGKQRRLKQAKEEAQEEIEKYRLERDRQFKEFEAKVTVIWLISQRQH